MRSPTEGDTQVLTMNLLHAGASLHGHEYSPAPSPNSSKPPRIPLRSYNSTPARPSSYQDSSKTTTNTLSSTYIRPARRLSNSRRRTITERVSFLDKPIDIHTSFIMPCSLNYESSDDGMSIASSQIAGSATSSAKRRNVKHTETNYYLAGPAPTMIQRQRLFHIRPKMILQLQRVPTSGRPVPILEVKTTSAFVPRIAKKFPSLYKGTGQLGINDVMICKSENYHTGEDGVVDEDTTCGTESYIENEVIAVICQAPKDTGYSGELVFDDGTSWVMREGTKKGVLELSKTDSHTGEKTIARWVPPGNSRRSSRSSFQTPVRGQAKGAAETKEKATDEKYMFSMVDPSRRRHPVMATLKQTGLTVKDTYSPLGPTPASSNASLAPSLKAMLGEEAAEATPSPATAQAAAQANLAANNHAYHLPSPSPSEIIRTTEDQKLLIEISAVWLASRLGWCPWSDAVHATPVTPVASGFNRQRSSTLGNTGSTSSKHRRHRSGTVGSIAEGAEPDTADGKTKSNKGSLTRRSGNIFKRSTLHANPHTSDSDHSPPRSGSSRTSPKRSVSTGAAFMQRQAEKRSSRPPSDAGSRPGSTTTSRNNSRPSSPRRACSVDLLTSFGRNVTHGEALMRGLAKYENRRNSLPTSPSSGPGAFRRAQSDFTVYDSGHSDGASPHLKIGEPVKPITTPNPLVTGHGEAPAPMTRRESAMGNKNGGKAMPKRAQTLPSRKARREPGVEVERGETAVVKVKVGKMKKFIAIFSKKQRRENELAEEGR